MAAKDARSTRPHLAPVRNRSPGRRGCDGLEREKRREHERDRKARVQIGPKRHQERQPPRRFFPLDGADQAAGA